MSMISSNDTIGNRTRDLPACSAVPQPIVERNVVVSNTRIGKRIFSSPNRPEWLCDPPCLLCSGYHGYWRALKKKLGHENLPSSNDKVIVNGTIALFPPVWTGATSAFSFFTLSRYRLEPITCIDITMTIQGVPGGKDQTSGECSLGQTIPI